MIAFNFHGDVLTVVAKGKVFNINKEDERFYRVKKALKDNDEDKIFNIMNTKEVFKRYVENKTDGKVTLIDDKVMYNGEELHNVIVDRIKEFAKNDLPFEHLLKFIENVKKNPSYRAQEELFRFLEHKYLPITEDGCFYAYKAIRDNWMDIYSNTIDNHIGNEITMDRNKVDDNKNKGCSKGLHCGSIEYVTTYGGTGSRKIIVKVNPEDVVSVPDDCSCQKIRVCKYVCWAEYQQPLEKPVYNDKVEYNYKEEEDDEWVDDGWDDYFNDDDEEDDDEENWYRDEEEDEDEDEEEEEDEEEDLNQWDDYVTSKDVSVNKCQRCGYHNKRDNMGRFCK